MRAGLIRRGAPALPHRGGRFRGRQVCRGTSAANGERGRRRDASGPPGATQLGIQAGELPTTATTSTTPPGPIEAAPERERLHYFVGTEELRRLLCLMAGTELLNELCQRLQGGPSASEV
ncbi:MAG TPA: hypothetical protein VFH68_12575 [Polyangia bacterium]|nr:hypothetical protein [Polyangia bacterium]